MSRLKSSLREVEINLPVRASDPSVTLDELKVLELPVRLDRPRVRRAVRPGRHLDVSLRGSLRGLLIGVGD